MIAVIRKYFDGKAQRAAAKLVEADQQMIDRWRVAVSNNITTRRGRWADVAYLRRDRARRYA